MSAITFVVAVVTASALLTVAACIPRAFQDRLGLVTNRCAGHDGDDATGTARSKPTTSNNPTENP
jgi:hypothetical protein